MHVEKLSVRDIPYSFFRGLMLPLLYSVSPLSGPVMSCRRLYSSPVDAQRLSRLWRFYTGFLPAAVLDRMAYALHWCPAFNQWSPCSVSLLSALAVSCRRPYSGSVDAQRLLRLHVSYAGSPPSAIAGSNALYPSLVSGIQPMVTVQCFTAF